MKNKYDAIYTVILLLFSVSLYAQSITFSELNYNSDSTINSGNWVELYNYGTSALDISGWYLKDDDNSNSFIFPSNTVLQAGGRLVVGNDNAKFTAEFPSVTNYMGEMTFSFGNDSDEVRLFDNAGTQKLFMHYTDSLPWPDAADGTGRTLELSDPNITPDDPSNWFVGCMHGSPGTAFIPCNDPLVFDEINYNSDTLLDAGDWIELYNHSLGGVNLTGWSLKDSKDDNIYFFPANTQIAPGARLVVVHDTLKFKTRHPTTPYIGPFQFNLSNDGELVRLFNYLGKLTFSIVYDDDGDWPAGADGDGYTLELLDASGNMNSSGDWFTGCPEGSPSVAYNPDCNVGIQETADQPAPTVIYADDHLMIHLTVAQSSSGDYAAAIFNDMGQELLRKNFTGAEAQISTRQFSQGIYILRITGGNIGWSQKFLIH